MYSALTPDLVEAIDSIKSLADQPKAARRKLDDAANALDRTASGIAEQAVKVGDPMLRQSATTVADGLRAASALCRAAVEAQA